MISDLLILFSCSKRN